MKKIPFSTADKPRILAGEWPAQDVPPPALAKMYNDMSARNGELLEELATLRLTMQALRDDPETPEGIRQRIAEAIAGE